MVSTPRLPPEHQAVDQPSDRHVGGVAQSGFRDGTPEGSPPARGLATSPSTQSATRPRIGEILPESRFRPLSFLPPDASRGTEGRPIRRAGSAVRPEIWDGTRGGSPPARGACTEPPNTIRQPGSCQEDPIGIESSAPLLPSARRSPRDGGSTRLEGPGRRADRGEGPMPPMVPRTCPVGNFTWRPRRVPSFSRGLTRAPPHKPPPGRVSGRSYRDRHSGPCGIVI